MIHHSDDTRRPQSAVATAPSGREGPDQAVPAHRRGAFMVLAFFALLAAMGFVAFSIDTGHIALNKTIMQNGVEAAALAAAMEITHAIQNAPPETTDPAAYARIQARLCAAETAAQNGVYVDPNVDVQLGMGWFNPATQNFEIQWGVEPSNVVKVAARREKDDTSQPDGKLPVLFAGVLGSGATTMRSEAIAYIESRDIAVVLDFSGSMAYDSMLRSDSVAKLGVEAIVQNLEQIFNELQMEDGALGTLDHSDPDDPNSVRDAHAKWLSVHGPAPTHAGEAQVDVTYRYKQIDVEATKPFKRVELKFSNGNTQTFSSLNTTARTFAGTGGNAGREIDDVWVTYVSQTQAIPPQNVDVRLRLTDSNWNVKKFFNLDSTPWPFNDGGWDSYIDYVRSNGDINRGSLREMYGGSTLAHYLLQQQPSHAETPELARTSHYPFHAVRTGNEVFVDFLDTLGFGDHVGLVSYDQERRVEDSLVEDGLALNISYDPLDNHYDALKTIMQYKQANHYFSRTNIGGGIREARELLKDHGRQSAKPTILLMTDGNANVHENAAGIDSLSSSFAEDGFYEMPADFDWSSLTYTDGTSFEIDDDSSYLNKARLFALSQALAAAEEGMTIHALAVGAGADRELMRAIAHIGHGEFISVEGDLSIQDLQNEVEAGFFRIAAMVPPARLLAEPDAD
jgi:Flp pilus assembly protein TadG